MYNRIPLILNAKKELQNAALFYLPKRILKRNTSYAKLEPQKANIGSIDPFDTRMGILEFWFAVKSKKVIALRKQAR